MAKAHPIELRERVVTHVQASYTRARRAKVGTGFAQKDVR